MDFEVYHKYPPGDPTLVDKIVCHLKAQGIFDNFRKECLSDVDTKPAYQNLRQRVDGSVAGYLAGHKWRPDLNKNQLRENLRKYIQNGGFLEVGVERIVDQVVNPKIGQVFLPRVRDVVFEGLGLKEESDSNVTASDRPASSSYMPSSSSSAASSTYTSASICNQIDDSKGNADLKKELVVPSTECEVKKEHNESGKAEHSEEIVASKVELDPVSKSEETVIRLETQNETRSNDSFESRISGISDLTSVKSNNSSKDLSASDDENNFDKSLNTDGDNEREDADNIDKSMTSVNEDDENSHDKIKMPPNAIHNRSFTDLSLSSEFSTQVEHLEIETDQIGTSVVECVTTENNGEDTDGRDSPDLMTKAIEPNYDSDSNGKYEKEIEPQESTEIEYDYNYDKEYYNKVDETVYEDHKEENHFEESQSETDVERFDSTSNDMRFSENTNCFDDGKLEKSSEDESYKRHSYKEKDETKKERKYRKEQERKNHSKSKHTKDHHHSNSSSGESRDDRKHRKSKDKHRHNRDDDDSHSCSVEDKLRKTYDHSDSNHRKSRRGEEGEEEAATIYQEGTSRSESKKNKHLDKEDEFSHKERSSRSNEYVNVIEETANYNKIGEDSKSECSEKNKYKETVKDSHEVGHSRTRDRKKASKGETRDDEYVETSDHEEATKSESDDKNEYKENPKYLHEERPTRSRMRKKAFKEDYEYGEITSDYEEASKSESEEKNKYKEKVKYSHGERHNHSRDRKKASKEKNRDYEYKETTFDHEESSKSESDEKKRYKEKAKFPHEEQDTHSRDRKKADQEEAYDFENEESTFDHKEHSKSEFGGENEYQEVKQSQKERTSRSRRHKNAKSEKFDEYEYEKATLDQEETSKSESDEKNKYQEKVKGSHKEKHSRSRDHGKSHNDEQEEAIFDEETKHSQKERRSREQKHASKVKTHDDEHEEIMFSQQEANESEVDVENKYQEVENSHKERHSRSRDHKHTSKEKAHDGDHKQKKEEHHRSDSDKKKHDSSSKNRHSTTQDDVKKDRSHKTSSKEHRSSHHRSSRDKHATKELENYDVEKQKHDENNDDKSKKDKSKKSRDSCKPADKSREHKRSADGDSSGTGDSRSLGSASAGSSRHTRSQRTKTKENRSGGKGSNGSTSDTVLVLSSTELEESQDYFVNNNVEECVEIVLQPSFSTNDNGIHHADDAVPSADEHNSRPTGRIVSEGNEDTQISQEKTEDIDEEKAEDVALKEQENHERELDQLLTKDIHKKITLEFEGPQILNNELEKQKKIELSNINSPVNTQENSENKENCEEKSNSNHQAEGKNTDVLGNKSGVQQDGETKSHGGNEEINPEILVTNIETQLPKDDNIKFRKKRFAANIAEVRKIMRERRRNERVQKKRLSVGDPAASDTSMTHQSIDNQTPVEENRLVESLTIMECNKEIPTPEPNEPSSFENSAECTKETVQNRDSLPLPEYEANSTKYKRPKFAANIYEVRKIIKARRRLRRMEKKRSNLPDLNLSQRSVEGESKTRIEDSKENGDEINENATFENNTRSQLKERVTKNVLNKLEFDLTNDRTENETENLISLKIKSQECVGSETKNFECKSSLSYQDIDQLASKCLIVKLKKLDEADLKKNLDGVASSIKTLNADKTDDLADSELLLQNNENEIQSVRNLDNIEDCSSFITSERKIIENELHSLEAEKVEEADLLTRESEIIDNDLSSLKTITGEDKKSDPHRQSKFTSEVPDSNEVNEICAHEESKSISGEDKMSHLHRQSKCTSEVPDSNEVNEICAHEESKSISGEDKMSHLHRQSKCTSEVPDSNEVNEICAHEESKSISGEDKMSHLHRQSKCTSEVPDLDEGNEKCAHEESKSISGEDKMSHLHRQSTCTSEVPDSNEVNEICAHEESKSISVEDKKSHLHRESECTSEVPDLNEVNEICAHEDSESISVEDKKSHLHTESECTSEVPDLNEVNDIRAHEESESISNNTEVKNSNESETLVLVDDVTGSRSCEEQKSVANVPEIESITESIAVLDDTTRSHSVDKTQTIEEVEGLDTSETLEDGIESNSSRKLQSVEKVRKVQIVNPFKALKRDSFKQLTSVTKVDNSVPMRGFDSFDTDPNEIIAFCNNNEIETRPRARSKSPVNELSNRYVESENGALLGFLKDEDPCIRESRYFEKREIDKAIEKLEKFKTVLNALEKEYNNLKDMEKIDLVTSEFALDKKFDSYLEKEYGFQVLRKDCILLPSLNDENYYFNKERGCYYLKSRLVDSSKTGNNNMDVRKSNVLQSGESSGCFAEKRSVPGKSVFQEQRKSPVKLRISIRNPNSSAIETEEINVPYTSDVESSTDGSAGRISIDSRKSVEDAASESEAINFEDQVRASTPLQDDDDDDDSVVTAESGRVQPISDQISLDENSSKSTKKKRGHWHRKRSLNSSDTVTSHQEFKIKTCPEAENNNLPSDEGTARLNSFKITLSRNNPNLSRIIAPQSPSSQSNNYSTDAAVPNESDSFIIGKRHSSKTDSVEDVRFSPKKKFDSSFSDTDFKNIDQAIETVTDSLNNSFEEELDISHDESMTSNMIGEALKNLIAESGLATITQSPPSYQETKEPVARVTKHQRNQKLSVEPENTIEASVSPPKKLRNSVRLSAGVRVPKRYENTDLYKPRLDLGQGNRRKRKPDEPVIDSLVDNEPAPSKRIRLSNVVGSARRSSR